MCCVVQRDVIKCSIFEIFSGEKVRSELRVCNLIIGINLMLIYLNFFFYGNVSFTELRLVFS